MERLDLILTPHQQITGIRNLGDQYPDNLEKKDLVVWWYGSLSKGIRDATQPKVAVLMRELVDNEGRLGSFHCLRVNITYIGLMRIGSVWTFGKDGKATRVKQAIYTTKEFTINFSPRGWDYYSLSSSSSQYKPYLIPRTTYPIYGGYTKYMANSWMTRFYLGNEESLLVPCLELFTRTYGVSQELKRVLLTLPWDKAEKRFFAVPKRPLPNLPNTWVICLGRDMKKNDAMFLAHLKYNPYTTNQARFLSAQVQAGSENDTMFLQVPPWSTGTGKLKVAGLEIPETKQFLALNILKASFPNSPPISYDLANPNDAEEEDEETAVGEGWKNGERLHQIMTSGEMALSDDISPGHGTGMAEIEEMPMEWDNIPILRKIQHDKKLVTRDEQAPGPAGDTSSTDERYGGEKGIDKASIETPIQLESHGTLWDVWEALNRFKHEQPYITQVEFFTFENGFQTDVSPLLIPFSGEHNTDKGKLWVTMNSGRNRGALVMRLHTISGIVYLMEIEREYNDDGNEEKDSFRGLAFKVRDEDTFMHALSELLHALPEHNGGFKKLLHLFDAGMADTFKHCKSNNNKYPCENVVKNILIKMNITSK